MNFKNVQILLYLFFVSGTALFGQSSQNPIPDKMMQDMYNTVKTPFKYGLVMVALEDSQKIDCPSIFRKDNLWYMVYAVADSRGTETWLAQSNDLLNWNTKGRIMSLSPGAAWDANLKAGTIALQDITWEGTYQWQKYNNRYWMSYSGGNARNNEAGPLSVGVSYSYQDPAVVREWLRPAVPALAPTDPDSRWSENGNLYRSFVMRDNQQFTGHPFVMYYNAKGDSVSRTGGAERINMAVSDDMIHWTRYGKNPAINHHTGKSGDPVIQKIGNQYVMFYYGASWKERKDAGAFNRFACSYDLVNWTDWTGPDLIRPSEPYDEAHAFKSCVIKYKGIVYHFYCAVNKKEQQGIAVATSVDMGKSGLAFRK